MAFVRFGLHSQKQHIITYAVKTNRNIKTDLDKAKRTSNKRGLENKAILNYKGNVNKTFPSFRQQTESFRP